MADKKGSRPNASLSGLLEEHALIAEREKAEIESKLREREEAERKARDEAERRERAILQERLEAEKRRQRDRLERQRQRAGEEDAVASPAPGPAPAPVVIQSPAPSATGKVLAAVAATIVVVGGAAVAVWFVLFADNSQALAAVARQGQAIVAESAARATFVDATYEAERRIAGLSERVATLEKQLAEAHEAINKLDAEKAEALKKAAEEARLRAEAEAAKPSGNGRRPATKRDPDALTIKPGVFAP